MRRTKLTRALKRGGIAERRTDGVHKVWRCGNRRRRPLGIIPKSRGDALRSDGKLVLLAGETAVYAWSGEREFRSYSHVPSPVLPNYKSERKARRTLLVRAVEQAADAREQYRFADAIKRFVADTERAGCAGRVTMNWQTLATGHQRGTRRSGGHLPGYARASAQARLDVLGAVLGEERFRLLELALVQEISAAEFARRLNVTPASVPEYLANLLGELSKAYDQKVDPA